MKFLSFLFLSVFTAISGIAQDLNSIIKEADRLEAIPDEKAAFQKFKEALKVQPSNLYALTKCSELCTRIGGREKTNTKLRDDYYSTAIIYAKTALRLYPNSDEANVTMALAVGRTILLKSGKEKISAVKDLKAYADKAVAENPNNFKAWHILGKWNYEVSNLNAIERAGAKIMYGGLPNASLKNSIMYYEKAKSINPSFALNYLELAKAYHRNDDDAKANAQLNYLLTLKNMTEDDPRIKTEAQQLLKDWN
jgi:tetratricopeptide (TPR) repeat protein